MCNYRVIVVFAILVIFVVMFFMSDQVQLFFRNKEGFAFTGFNNQLVRIWNDPNMEGTWKLTYPVNKKWMLTDVKDQSNKRLYNQNSSVSFWMFVNKNSGNWNHIFSLRSPTMDRYLGIWIRPNRPGLHIRSSTDDKWNSGDNFQGETGYYNQNEENNHFPLNRAVFVVVTLETPNPSPEQLKANPEKKYDSYYRLYIDGQLKNTHVHSSTIKSLEEDDKAYVMVGRKVSGRNFHNYALKDIHLYNHTIGETDIQNLYTTVKHQNNPDEAKRLFTESFQLMHNDSKEGFQSNGDKNKNDKEGFVTAEQCQSVVLPGYKQYFDFYKNVKVVKADGKPCQYNYTTSSQKKTIRVGPHDGNGVKTVDLTSQNINKEDEIDPTPTNEMDPNWKDTFRIEREGENRQILKVYRIDPSYGKDSTTAGWGMNLEFETHTTVFTKNNIDWEKYYDRYRGTPSNPDFVANNLPRTLDAVWSHWNTHGKGEGRIMTVKDETRLTCGSSKPLCVDSNSRQYGLCGKEIALFDYDPNRDKVVLWEHNDSGWKVELPISRIPNMANYNGKDLRGLSTIVIPENMKVVVFDQPNYSGNQLKLLGPQTVYLGQYGNGAFNDKVQSLKVKSDGFRFKTTYNNDSSNPIHDESDWRLDKDDLRMEDTLDKHFSMDGPQKKMRFIELESNADWRKGTRVNTNLSYEQAEEISRGKTFSRLDFRNLKLRLGNNGITFCLWFKCKGDNNEQWARLFDLGDGYRTNNILMAFSGKKLHFRIVKPGSGDAWGSVLPNVNDNEWYHLAWVIGKPDTNGKCDWTTYINGIVADKSTDGNKNYPPDVVRENLFLGASNYWWDPHFNGCIADVRIYKEPLNDAQVCKVYNNPDSQD